MRIVRQTPKPLGARFACEHPDELGIPCGTMFVVRMSEIRYRPALKQMRQWHADCPICGRDVAVYELDALYDAALVPGVERRERPTECIFDCRQRDAHGIPCGTRAAARIDEMRRLPNGEGWCIACPVCGQKVVATQLVQCKSFHS